MSDSFLLIFGGYLPKPLTAEQEKIRGIGLHCIDNLVLAGGMYPAAAINLVCSVLDSAVRGFAKWQYDFLG